MFIPSKMPESYAWLNSQEPMHLQLSPYFCQSLAIILPGIRHNVPQSGESVSICRSITWGRETDTAGGEGSAAMTDTAGSMPMGHPRAAKKRPSRDKMLLETPTINDPNSPQMTAMIKSMLLDQKREERQRRLPELSPPEPGAASKEPVQTEDAKLTKLDISKLVPSMPALRPRREKPVANASATRVAPEIDDEVELLSRDVLVPDPEDVITPEDIAEVVNKDKTDRKKARKTFKGDIWPVLKTHFSTLETHAKNIKTKHVVLTMALLIAILRPWLVIGVTLALLMIFAITYLSLGHERFAEVLLARWLRFKQRKPKKAEQYFNKATQLVEQYNAKVARLPEAMAERLTLPDLAELEKEDDRPDPFDRLAEQAKEV